jgi:hypothetical protein
MNIYFSRHAVIFCVMLNFCSVSLLDHSSFCFCIANDLICSLQSPHFYMELPMLKGEHSIQSEESWVISSQILETNGQVGQNQSPCH